MKLTKLSHEDEKQNSAYCYRGILIALGMEAAACALFALVAAGLKFLFP